MVVTVEPGANPETVKSELVALGLWVRRADAGDRVLFVVDERSAAVPPQALRAIPGVESVATEKSTHPLVDAHARVVRVGRVTFGTGAPVILSGPCSVESRDHVRRLAHELGSMGVQVLRGGAFKPRTSPYDFQGAGREALGWMREAADDAGLAIVTEALAPEEVPMVAEHAELIQVGSRNMHNFPLLRAVGLAGRPVLLKRGMAATIEEWLHAAEYCLVHGAPSVIFCERGIRSFDPSTRNVLDVGAIALLSHVYRLPVVSDPSHGAGRRDLIAPLARASIAAGACGVMIETHESPGTALSDGPQALSPAELSKLVAELRPPGKEESARV